MKKLNYFLVATILAAVFTMTSCKKDDKEVCHECHIALPDKSETAWDITNSSGEEEFCGEELEDAESSSYIYTVTEILVSDDGDTLFPGEYGPGSANSQYEIHCEEHGEHDGHDHK
tara:strand:+ start:23015 stop:23362 length:348 start_codon:yes stop_codon:yes gene_type:complete